MNKNEHRITRDKPAPAASLRSYVRPVLERKWIVLLTFLATLGAIFYALKTSQSVYEAQVVMMRIESNRDPSLILSAQRYIQELPNTNLIDGHIEILRSASSIETIQELLKKKENLEFTKRQIKAGFSLKSDRRSSVIIRLAATADTPERAQALANTTAEFYIQKLNQIQKADLIHGMTFLGQQMVTVNEKLEAVEETLNRLRADNDTFVSGRGSSSASLSNELFNQLQEWEVELSKTQMEIGLTETQLKTLQNSIAEGESISSSASSRIGQIQSKLGEMQLQLDSLRGNFTEKDSEVVSVRRQIAALQESLDGELAKLGNNGHNKIYLLSELQRLRQQAASLDLDLGGLKQKEVLLKQKIATFEAEHPNMVSEQMKLTSLERQARVHEQTYMMLLEKHEEVSLLQHMEMNRLQIIQAAELPRSPTGLTGKMLFPLGCVLGLGLGIGLAFVLEYLDDSIKRKEDVEKYLALPTIGVIPKMRPFEVPKSALIENNKRQRKETEQLLSHILPFDTIGGEYGGYGEYGEYGGYGGLTNYQRLAAQIRYAKVGTPTQTLLITSALANEGKTTTATNLAISLAQAGKKVLLLDADLRRGQIHNIFQQDSSPGLTDFLIGENKSVPLEAPITEDFRVEESFIRLTPVDNLYIFPAGTQVSNPELFLSSEEMEGLIKRLREAYDIILLDSAPVILTADAMSLAPHMEGTLLVIKSGTTTRQIALQATELLDNVNAGILGVVLNERGKQPRMKTRRVGSKFTDEERELYRTVFEPYLTADQFMMLMRVAEWENLESHQILTKQGESVSFLMFIYEGSAAVEIDGNIATTLNQGAFIGEMSFTTNEPASATVKVATPTRLVRWPQDRLRQLLKQHRSLGVAIQAVVSTDMVQKLRKSARK